MATNSKQPPTSATSLLEATLKSWGLASLIPDAKKYLTGGYSADQVTIALQNTTAYKTRFAANAIREKAGLPVLSPASYIGLEDQYRQTMRQYGLPSGFYDKVSDFTNFIAGDVSPTELESRVQLAQQSYTTATASQKSEWQKLFGVASQGSAIAAILDPKTSLPLLQQQAAAVDVASAGADQGLNVSKAQAVKFGDLGVTLADARKAYADISTNLAAATSIGNRFGTPMDQSTLENAELGGDGKAAAALTNASDEEQGLFHANPGANTASLGISSSY